jgi:hypothetical protein
VMMWREGVTSCSADQNVLDRDVGYHLDIMVVYVGKVSVFSDWCDFLFLVQCKGGSI